VSGYRFHHEALLDLDRIWLHIAKDSVSASEKVVDQILAALAGVARLPYLGYQRPDLTSRPLRFINVSSYLIAYAPELKPVFVLAVIHGRRSPLVIAAILRGRQ
jgi:plasmid stabilization system protein ParE